MTGEQIGDNLAALNRQRFVNSIRPMDAFLVTYPKSGTVWLSYLIANALCADPKERLDLQKHGYVVNINELYFGGGSLDEIVCRSDPRLFWLHSRYDPEFRRVVYLLRDPRDVMTSYWHWKRMVEPRFRLSIRDFVSDNKIWPCRWDEHVFDWVLSHHDPAPLVIRYEDLHRETSVVLARVLHFLDLPQTVDDIERAVNAGSFVCMRSLEEELKAAGRTLSVPSSGAVGDRDERFMRRGRIGGWKDELDPGTVRIIERKYGDVMRAVGYEPVT